MGRSFQPAVIKNGTSLQDITSPNAPIVVNDGEIVGIMADPTAWTGAVITFATLLADGVTWGPVYDEAGAEVSIAAAGLVAGQYVAIKEASKALRGLGRVRLRSGTAGAAVGQGADRTLQVAVLIDTD